MNRRIKFVRYQGTTIHQRIEHEREHIYKTDGSPERPELIAEYVQKIPEFAYRTRIKAGLTGYAQVYGKYKTTPYDKLILDLSYMENYSFWLDIKILILTFNTILKKDSSEGV